MDPKMKIPPYIREGQCSVCKAGIFCSPSSITQVEQGNCVLICYECAEQHLDGNVLITMAPGAVEEYRAYQQLEVEKN
jgi:hypothetical protein